MPEAPEVKDVDVALVLGGGGAKGFAHVGVLEVLEEEGIPVDLIVGTSAGALIGGLYAGLQDAQIVKGKVMSLKKWDIMDLSISSMMQMMFTASGPVSGFNLERFFVNNLPQERIEELEIPFAAVAVDVETSEPVVLRSGPVAPAVHASAAIPGFFTPVKLYGRTLMDGGALLPVPVEVARDYEPKVIIAVDICAPADRGKAYNSMDVMYRALCISYYELARKQSKLADINIHPNMEGFGMFDDDRNEDIYMRGVLAARSALPAIKAKLEALGIPLRERKTRSKRVNELGVKTRHPKAVAKPLGIRRPDWDIYKN